MKNRQLETILHILFWLLSIWMLSQAFVFEATEIKEINGVRTEYYVKDHQMFYLLAITMLSKMVWVYGNILWGGKRFLKDKNLWAYLARLGALLIISVLLEGMMIQIFASILPFENIHISAWAANWQLNILLYILYFALSQAYIFTKNWKRQERLKEQLEKENMATELNFLKSQINPHFLFNTLNNLFAMAEEAQQKSLSEGIAGLSDLMRYMLDDCKSDRVLVEKEVRFLHSVIELQRLRIAPDDDIIIAFNIQGDIDRKRIAPFILIPFVENAFKHGINWGGSSFIKIEFSVEEEHLDFHIVNSYFPSAVSEDPSKDGGIGLMNVKRRLALIYPQTHHLDISVKNDTFHVRLRLTLD